MIQIPKYLTDDSKKYWQAHAKRLTEAGLLTEADVESFALLCQVWGLLRRCQPEQDSKEAIRFVGLMKQFYNLAKQFGMMPKDRRQAKLEVQKEEADEYGL